MCKGKRLYTKNDRKMMWGLHINERYHLLECTSNSKQRKIQTNPKKKFEEDDGITNEYPRCHIAWAGESQAATHGAIWCCRTKNALKS